MLLEQYGLQTRQVVFQTFFTVGVEEELCIRQTWAHHFLVTGDNLDRIFRFDVRHEDEVWQQLAVVGVYREVLLVTLHGIDQRFCRNGQEFLFELRGQHNWPFHQRGHFFQQAFAQVSVTANLARRFFRVRFDFGFTLFVVGNDFTALQQDLRVLVGIVDGELRLAHKAVAADHAIGRHAQNGRWNHGIAQQQGHGVNRTHEVHVGRAPAHQLRNWQLSQ